MPDFIVKTDIDNFLQSDDKAAGRDNLGINLDSVTAAGATTLNDISVGRIATSHPNNPALSNSATGNQACAIGGIQNVVSGNRSVSYGGRENVITGNDSSTIGGYGQSVIGIESEALGSTNLKLFSKYTSAVGAANSTIGTLDGVAPNPEDLYENISDAKHSIILGGEYIEIQHAVHAATVGGQTNTIQTGHDRSVILGGTGITTDAADTAFVDNLDVKGSVYINQITAADTDKSGKCQLWVNATGDLYLTLPNGTDRQIAFV